MKQNNFLYLFVLCLFIISLCLVPLFVNKILIYYPLQIKSQNSNCSLKEYHSNLFEKLIDYRLDAEYMCKYEISQMPYFTDEYLIDNDVFIHSNTHLYSFEDRYIDNKNYGGKRAYLGISSIGLHTGSSNPYFILFRNCKNDMGITNDSIPMFSDILYIIWHNEIPQSKSTIRFSASPYIDSTTLTIETNLGRGDIMKLFPKFKGKIIHNTSRKFYINQKPSPDNVDFYDYIIKGKNHSNIDLYCPEKG